MTNVIELYLGFWLKEKKQKRELLEINHKIDIQEVIDYAKCPMYYFFKHKSSAPKTEHVNLVEKYDTDIHRVIYFSFHRLQEGGHIRIEDLKTHWGKAWIRDKRKSGIVFCDSLSNKDTYNERRKKGLDSLIGFHKAFSKSTGYPLLINRSYEIPITDKITLTGEFELIRETDMDGKKKVEVCIFKTDEHTNNKVNKEFDLKLSASALALGYYIDIDDLEIEYMVYNMDKRSMYYNRNIGKIKGLFKKSIINIYKAIYNKIFYLAPSDKCYNCIYKDSCSNIDGSGQFMDTLTKQ